MPRGGQQEDREPGGGRHVGHEIGEQVRDDDLVLRAFVGLLAQPLVACPGNEDPGQRAHAALQGRVAGAAIDGLVAVDEVADEQEQKGGSRARHARVAWQGPPADDERHEAEDQEHVAQREGGGDDQRGQASLSRRERRHDQGVGDDHAGAEEHRHGVQGEADRLGPRRHGFGELQQARHESG